MNRIKKITLAAFSLLLALIMLTGCNADAVWDHLTTPNADTLKNAELFDDCPDITCQMVMEKYLDSPTWNELTVDDKPNITVSGNIKGMELTLSLTAVVPDKDETGTPEFVKGTVGTEEITPASDITLLVSWMFQAYRDGYETFADWTSEHSPEKLLGNSGNN